MSTKEKKLVPDDRPANDAAKLVALQAVSLARKRIARIEDSVAHKFKQVAVEAVGARLRHAVDSARGMLSILGRHGAGFYFELLQGIRKRQWKVRIAERVVMTTAIQQIGQAIVQSAANRNVVGRPGPRGSLIAPADSGA